MAGAVCSDVSLTGFNDVQARRECTILELYAAATAGSSIGSRTEKVAQVGTMRFWQDTLCWCAAESTKIYSSLTGIWALQQMCMTA